MQSETWNKQNMVSRVIQCFHAGLPEGRDSFSLL